MVSVHRRRGTWTRSVDRFIALSEFSKSRFVAAGIPGDLIAVKPNFVYDRAARGGSDRSGALYVGRLSVEKGIATLLRAWRGSAVPLRIVGDGPLRPMITAANLATVEALGAKTPGEVADEMGRAAFLVLPSECYENFPLAVAEAFRQSLPVIGSRIGAVAEIVEDGKTGLHFLPGDSAALAASVRWAASHPEEIAAMGARARRVYEEKYTPDRNFRQLARIYEDAIARAGSQRA
jgi:glycosyltransferase involved in cell wall biosynthesis